MLKKLIEQASDLEGDLFMLRRTIDNLLEVRGEDEDLDAIGDKVEAQEKKAHELWKALLELRGKE